MCDTRSGLKSIKSLFSEVQLETVFFFFRCSYQVNLPEAIVVPPSIKGTHNNEVRFFHIKALLRGLQFLLGCHSHHPLLKK